MPFARRGRWVRGRDRRRGIVERRCACSPAPKGSSPRPAGGVTIANPEAASPARGCRPSRRAGRRLRDGSRPQDAGRGSPSRSARRRRSPPTLDAFHAALRSRHVREVGARTAMGCDHPHSPPSCAELTGGAAEVSIEGGTVKELLAGLDAAHPGFAGRLHDDSGELRRLRQRVRGRRGHPVPRRRRQPAVAPGQVREHRPPAGRRRLAKAVSRRSPAADRRARRRQAGSAVLRSSPRLASAARTPLLRYPLPHHGQGPGPHAPHIRHRPPRGPRSGASSIGIIATFLTQQNRRDALRAMWIGVGDRAPRSCAGGRGSR